ncbi:hypothetical protein [Pedobacter sp. UBA4863]|nr:hypothetical protein [Pedobacter sp. UBA4863]
MSRKELLMFVAQENGKISVKSNLGVGSTFTFSLNSLQGNRGHHIGST